MDIPHCHQVSRRTHSLCTSTTYCVDEIFAPVAQVEKNVAARRLQCIRHCFEAVEGYGRCADTAHVVATVILQHVDAPSCETLCIVDFMVQRTLCSTLADVSKFFS
jgi:hypothetical protein